jgi:hypothetical protein
MSTVSDPTVQAQQGKTVNIPIVTGWNLITVPVNITGFNASNLRDNITGCQFISYLNGTSQTFSTYTGNVASDFRILDGHGYLLYTTASSTLTLSGSPITTVNVPINVGWSLIGWFNDTSTMASSIHGNITGCQFISYLNGTTQTFSTYTGNVASDFVVTQGMGLLLYATTASNWHGEG